MPCAVHKRLESAPRSQDEIREFLVEEARREADEPEPEILAATRVSCPIDCAPRRRRMAADEAEFFRRQEEEHWEPVATGLGRVGRVGRVERVSTALPWPWDAQPPPRFGHVRRGGDEQKKRESRSSYWSGEGPIWPTTHYYRSKYPQGSEITAADELASEERTAAGRRKPGGPEPPEGF